MRHIWLARAFAALTGYLFFSSLAVTQSEHTPTQRALSVENHLTRYVVIKNSDQSYMQLPSQMESMHVPAVSMVAIRKGQIDWAEAHGLTSLGGARATTRTLFASYMKRAVLDPIGMKDSTFDSPLSAHWASRAATGYWEDGKSGLPPTKLVEPNLAAGGLWTTPTDLAMFLIEMQREYQGASHKLLHQATVQTMVKPGPGGWGLGFKIGGSPENPVLSHEGSGVFQDDMLVYLNGNGFVVMTSGGGGGGLADELIRSAGRIYDFPDFRPMERSAVDVRPEVLSQYPGTYGFVKVTMDGDRLTAEIPEGTRPQPLYAESPTRFFVLDGPQELQFHKEGQKVNSVEFITPMGHHALTKNEEARK